MEPGVERQDNLATVDTPAVLTIQTSENNVNNSPKSLIVAINSLLIVLLYGLSLNTISIYGSELIQNHLFSLYGFALLGNFMATVIKINTSLQLIISSGLFTISAIIQAIIALFLYKAENIPLLRIIAFAFTGMAAGGTMNGVPSYIVQVCPPKYKQYLMSGIAGVGILGGLILGNNLNYFKYGILMTNAVILSISLFEILCLISLYSYTAQEAKTSINLKSIKEIGKNGKRSSAFITMCHFALHLSGVNYLVFHFINIFGTEHNVLYYNLVYGFSSLIAMASGYLVRFGRKQVYFVSTTITLVANILFYVGIYPILCALLFVFGFNLGMGPLPFYLITEVFPTAVIQEGSFIATTAYWIGGILFSFVPVHENSHKNPTFIYFISILGVFSLILLFIFKETKGKVPNFQ